MLTLFKVNSKDTVSKFRQCRNLLFIDVVLVSLLLAFNRLYTLS